MCRARESFWARQEFNRRKRRFNFCTSPGFEPEPGGVTGYLLLVSHPSPRFRVINHPGLRMIDHPAATTHENCIFVGPSIAAPLRRGELGTFPLRAEFPSVGGVSQRDGVVRECEISHLVYCHSRAGGNRAWVVNNYLILGIIQRYIFYSPAIRDMNLIDPIPACAGMTRVVCAWAITHLCHRERSVAIQ